MRRKPFSLHDQSVSSLLANQQDGDLSGRLMDVEQDAVLADHPEFPLRNGIGAFGPEPASQPGRISSRLRAMRPIHSIPRKDQNSGQSWAHQAPLCLSGGTVRLLASEVRPSSDLVQTGWRAGSPSQRQLQDCCQQDTSVALWEMTACLVLPTQEATGSSPVAPATQRAFVRASSTASG